LSATAADVHDWAKQSAQDFIVYVTDTGVEVTKTVDGKEVTTTIKLATDADISGLVNTIGELERSIEDIYNKISSSMHFIGFEQGVEVEGADGEKVIEYQITDGENSTPLISGWTSNTAYEPTAGDVVISNGLEYVYTSSSVWEQFGQEGSFAIKGSIADADIVTNAAIDQTKIAASLSGNATLADDISDLNQAITNHTDEYNTLNGAAWKSTLTTGNKYADALTASKGTAADLTIGSTPIACLVFSCGGAGEN
jgi:hypothetical protein